MIPEKYHIKRSENADLHPEETLADVLSEHQIMEAPIERGVFRVFYLVIAALAILLVFKSLQLQIIDGGHYRLVTQRSGAYRYFGPAFRGIIFDAGGQALVENIPVFDLVALYSDLPRSDAETAALIDAITPVIDYPNELLTKTFKDNENSALFSIKNGIGKEAVAKLQALALKGVYVVANARRYYPNSNVLAPVLGYTAKVSPADLAADDYYLLTDRIGRLGLEQYYEKELRGEHRNIILGQDQFSADIGNIGAGTAGHDLFLNIDAQIQSQLYRVMGNILASSGLKRGAAVVQNPKTGQILALVSFPSFDPNVFENSSDPANTEKIGKILNDRNKPLFNRVVSGRYSPGSTIKPLLALAGLKEGIITSQTKVNATGSITVRSIYDPDVFYTFNDWKVHGVTDLKKAIADSVDVYFYALGGGWGNIRGLGAGKIVEYLKAFWADQTLGIDLPGEVSGFVPTEKWKKDFKGEPWFIGDTYNISIGQGDLSITPLWLNGYISAIANGGRLLRPQLVKAVKNPNGQIIYEREPETLAILPFDSQTMAAVKAGMRQTVTAGTATLLNDLPVPVAAKTGTAQITGRGLNSLFTVYGPYDDPQIALTVLVENVQSQGLAVRIAHDFLAWYFTK